MTNITVQNPNIDLFMLFVHDHENSCWPYAGPVVEEAINKRLGEIYGGQAEAYEVMYPDMGRSWKVQGFLTGRLYSIEEVKAAFPEALVKQLEQIEREGLNLC